MSESDTDDLQKQQVKHERTYWDWNENCILNIKLKNQNIPYLTEM